MIIGINCGHTIRNTPGCGATGIINESDETRAVGYALTEKLRAVGNTVIDCTNDKSPTTAENLRRICETANSQPLDMFLSVHFNSGGGKGCEAYTFDGSDKANASGMLHALEALGFKNRGIKNGSKLYVVKNTKAPAVLLEVCFVDSALDCDLYKKLGPDKIADALIGAISIKPEKSDSKASTDIIYNHIDENMPEWARATVLKLVRKGYLTGSDTGLNLTEEMLRIFVVNDRAGLYD